MPKIGSKQAENEFSRNESYKTAAGEASFIFYCWDPASNDLVWELSAPNIFGYDPKDISRLPAFEKILHPKDLNLFRATLEKSTETKAAHDIEYRLKKKNGKTVRVRDQGRCLTDGGKPKVVGFLSDTTDTEPQDNQVGRANRKLFDILENISDGFLAIGKDRRFSYVNNRAAEMLRKKPEEMLGKKIEDVYPSIKQFSQFDILESDDTEPAEFEEYYEQFNSWYYFRVNPTDEGWVVYFQDITKQKQSAIELEKSRQRLELAQKVGNIGTFEWDLNSGKVIWTPELEALYGLQAGSFEGTYEAWQKLVHPEDLNLMKEKIASSVEKKLRELEIEFRILRPNGGQRWIKSKGRVYFSDSHRTIKVIGISMDITEQKQYEERIKYHIFNDPLTGLPNRLMFYERMRETIERTGSQGVTSIIIIDLDRFKNINDSLGHSAGDRVIQEVALRFQAALKERGLLARLGGDEFVIMMDDMGNEEEAAQVARDVLECLKIPVVFDGKELYSSASVGISLYPSDGEDTSTLLKNADAALYRAKEQGRNNFQFYSPSMNSLAFQKLTLENSMRRALANEEFLVYYQPQIDLKTGEIVQVEALVRWMHPDFGLMFPDEFIELAETNGLIEAIGERVLRLACLQMIEWNRMGLGCLRLSVNMSARQFRRKHLVKTVRKILDETKFDPHRLELELTESVLVEDFGNTLNTMWELKRDGIKFSLDDFNTRYSSLNYIKRFPIDILKIDRSFVKGLPGNEKDSAIADSIINLAQTLNYSVVAEGVEREEQLRYLKRRGCDRAQGYLFSPPSPPDSLLKVLLKRNIGGVVKS